jgi:hypothetical protein
MGVEMSREPVGVDTEPTISREERSATQVPDLWQTTATAMGLPTGLVAYWEANKRTLLAGVRFSSDDVREEIESRPPDRWIDRIPEPVGDPYIRQDIRSSLFNVWTEWVEVQPMQRKISFLWDMPNGNTIGFNTTLSEPPSESLATFKK